MATKEREQQRRLDFERSQNIALLSLVTKNPALPGANTCPLHISKQKKERTLSLSRESHLAEAVAFISGISDSPDHVVAISLEEQPAGAGLRILVAINRSTHARPTDERILGRIRSGLEAVFRLLSRAGTENEDNLEEQVTDAIIDLCRDRILARMRSQRNDASISKWKGRPFAGSNVEGILSAIRRHSFAKRIASKSDPQLFILQLERLIAALKKVESSESRRVNVALKELVITACSLHRGRRSVNIAGILSDLSNTELAPSDALWFKIWIRKLSRYRECSGYLFRTARKTDLFTNVAVVPVSLGQEYFVRQGETPNETCLANCIARCRKEDPQCGKEQVRAGTAALTKLGTPEFLPVLKKILKESRIHAEVQIVAYYELHPTRLPPRIIKSSKDACYLCHMFIKEHGKFFTPRTHGRLYNGWRLPNMVGLNKTQAKLNSSLQARIWEGALVYALTKKVPLLICVNESDVGSLSPMSSLASFGLLSESAVVLKDIKQIPPSARVMNIADGASSRNRELDGIAAPGIPVDTPKKDSKLTTIEEEENPAVETAPPEVGSSGNDEAHVPLQSVQMPNDGLPRGETTGQAMEQLPETQSASTSKVTVMRLDDQLQLSTSQSSSDDEYEDEDEDDGEDEDEEDEDEDEDEDESEGDEVDDIVSPEEGEPEITPQTSPELESEPELEVGSESAVPTQDPPAHEHKQPQARKANSEFENKLEKELGRKSPNLPSPEKPPRTPSAEGSFPHRHHSSIYDLDSNATVGRLGTSRASSPLHRLSESTWEKIRDPVQDNEPGDDNAQGADDDDDDDKDQDVEIILTQGQPSSFMFTGHKKRKQTIPVYRNGKAGKLILHPEYIITKTTTTGDTKGHSSRSLDETVQLKITWLLPTTTGNHATIFPSSPSPSPSQNLSPQQQNTCTQIQRGSQKDRDMWNNGGPSKSLDVDVDVMEIPTFMFMADALPTEHDTDTGSGELVRLVDRDGEVVLVEVLRGL